MPCRHLSASRVEGLGGQDEYAIDPACPTSTLRPCPPARPKPMPLAVAATLPGSRIVCTTIGRGQAAEALARTRPEAAVTCWFLDLYQRDAAAACWGAGAAGKPRRPPARPTCRRVRTTWPSCRSPRAARRSSPATSSSRRCSSLAIGGRLVAAVDNARDKWLREQLAATGETVRVRPGEDGRDTIAYVVEKTREPAKVRDFSCRFKFRDRERLLEAVSRPGVFAHRRIDPGARHLLNAVDVGPRDPGARHRLRQRLRGPRDRRPATRASWCTPSTRRPGRSSARGWVPSATA